ncbi:hypothetical protein T03_11611 [Trichinella britovi]|uniref:Uncharacterized protein n=1 Tax=Trichinella britovi TaxID=45882 RepID=A0A0V1AKQ3_TRIBR|nr:hypothetical protein T03_11611 [Trichinella britovi]
MKIQQLDSSEAEIILCGRKWTPSSNRLKSTTALLKLIKRFFPWRLPLTLLGPQMMLWFLRAIVARAVRNRKGYAVSYDSLVTMRGSLGPGNHKSLN